MQGGILLVVVIVIVAVLSAGPVADGDPADTAGPSSGNTGVDCPSSPAPFTLELAVGSSSASSGKPGALVVAGDTQIRLSPSGPQQLFRLTQTVAATGATTLAARSYDGGAWESAAPVRLRVVCGTAEEGITCGRLYATAAGAGSAMHDLLGAASGGRWEPAQRRAPVPHRDLRLQLGPAVGPERRRAVPDQGRLTTKIR